MARAGMVNYLFGTSFYKMAYVEYGKPSAPTVVCVHGLTRNSHDFDSLAEALSDRFHVICPDLPGRGDSDWLPDGLAYQPPTYVVALAHLLAQINEPVAWVGTSLGGICGMLLAAAQNTPITRLILNDIGPHIPAEALQRIRDYMLSAPDHFASMADLTAHLRLIHAPFGLLSDAQWAHLARFSARQVPDPGNAGKYIALHYDPRIIAPMKATSPLDVDMWPIWEAIKSPRLVIRGLQSDLLLPPTYERMLAEGAEGYVVADAGHAPALMDRASQARIKAFLLEGS